MSEFINDTLYYDEFEYEELLAELHRMKTALEQINDYASHLDENEYDTIAAMVRAGLDVF